MISGEPSMPILIASATMSSAIARIWQKTRFGETNSTFSTAPVFWAVIAVIAVIPCTPTRANAFRSAWMPAPPPESEPAIERTAGTRSAAMYRSLESRIVRRRRQSAHVGAQIGAGEVAEQLQPGERDSRGWTREAGGGGHRIAGRVAGLDRSESGFEVGVESRSGTFDLGAARPQHRVENVLGVADDMGAGGEQAVGPGGGAGGDRAGDGAEVAAEVGGQVGGDQRAGASGGLDHHGHPGECGHDPVAGGEGPAPGGGAGPGLGDDEAGLADAAPEGAMAGGVGDGPAAAQGGGRPAGRRGAAGGAGA